MSWATETNIKGPPGPPGADSTVPGPTGATGPTGPQGPQGPPGASGSGSGNVNGPAPPVVDNRIVIWNGTTATAIKDSGTLVSDLAPINSPVFTGDPQAPTPTVGDNDTSIATTAFVTAALAAGGGGGTASGTTFTPAGNIAATNVQAALVELDTEKVAKAGDTMTGALTLPAGAVGTPSLMFTGSGATTGMYSGGASTLTFTVAGTIRVAFNATVFNLTGLQFRGSDGLVSAPGLSFLSEAGSGFYRKAGGSVSVSGTNNEVMNWVGSTKVTTAYGPIVLPADPTTALQAATKQYVDAKPGGAIVSDTAPVGAAAGALWWESDTGLFYVNYNDGDSTQWVMAMPLADATRYAVRFDTAQTLTVTQKTQARDNIGVSKKNYVINGGMQVSQENGATAVTVNGTFPVDQFVVVFSNAGTQTLQQVAAVTPSGSLNRLRVTATVADASVAVGDSCLLLQAIEGLRTADLKLGSAAAKTVTIQFGVKAPAGTYCIAIRNAAVNRSYVAEYVVAAGEANTDVVKAVTIPLDQTGTWAADNTTGLYVSWSLMAGTMAQTTANAWQAGNFTATANQFNFMGTINNVFELFDVGLYEGAVAPAFQVPDYPSELTVCQRYWEKTVVVCSTVANTGSTSSFLTAKRAAPTLGVALGGGSGATYAITGDPNAAKFYQSAVNTIVTTAVITGNARL